MDSALRKKYLWLLEEFFELTENPNAEQLSSTELFLITDQSSRFSQTISDRSPEMWRRIEFWWHTGVWPTKGYHGQ